MSIQDIFLAYAEDFERSYESNDWSNLAQYFTENASYDSGDGQPIAQGRDAVLQKFESAVDGLDRKMGQREIIAGELSTEGDTVVLKWTARYTTGGLPELAINGTEYARFEGERMVELRDVIDEQSLAIVGEWMAAHGDSL